MSELQAALEFQVEISKFCNVDLFQRGYYQIRAFMKSSPKTPVKIEVSLPKNSECNLVFPASVINGIAVSKTFHILYRNEDVVINDVIVFKVYMLVDSQRITQSIEEADFHLNVELWFTDEEVGKRGIVSPDQMEKFQCISERLVRLSFCPTASFHDHAQLLFDYFHLSVVCVTVHGVLLALQQPYINLTRQLPKSAWSSKNHPTMEAVLFGGTTSPHQMPSSSLSPRLQQACHIHKQICGILLMAYDSLQHNTEQLLLKLAPAPHDYKHIDCHQKLHDLCMTAQRQTCEEELFQMIQTTIAQLCAQNVILWSQFIELVSLKVEMTHILATKHHTTRVKRFSEAFFIHHYQKQEMLACFEQSVHGHSDVASVVRSSQYWQTLQPLDLHCAELDGQHTSLPIIFEDVYCEAARLAQFRVGANDAASDDQVSRSDSSRSGSSSSPKSRRHTSRKKIPTNLKLETLKRPSSMYTQQISNQVALEAPSCTLVGYRKLDQPPAMPTMELGTLSPAVEARPLALDASAFPCLRNTLASHTSLPELNLNSLPSHTFTRHSLCIDLPPSTPLDSLIRSDVPKSDNINEDEIHKSNSSLETIDSAKEDTRNMMQETQGKDSSESDEGLEGPIENGYFASSVCSSNSSVNNIPEQVVADEASAGVEECTEPSSEDKEMTKNLVEESEPLNEAQSTSDSGFIEAASTESKVATPLQCTVLELFKEEYNQAHSQDRSIGEGVLQSVSQTDINNPAISSTQPSDPSAQPNKDVTKTSSTKETLISDEPATVALPKPSNSGTQLNQVVLAESASLPELSNLENKVRRLHLDQRAEEKASSFRLAKDLLKKQIRYMGKWYSDDVGPASAVPYFWPQSLGQSRSDDGIHLIVCVHGLDGNSADLRLVRTYLELALPGEKVDFLMSEKNQIDTFADFDVMTQKLVDEIFYHIEVYGLDPARISFIGHSLGNLIIRSSLAHPKMAVLLPKLYTLLSLSGPHLGTLYNSSGLVNMGMWFMQKWKKSGSLLQLSLKDHSDPRQTFLYKLSQKSGLEFFRNILLVGSQQDRYVPYHSSRIEHCRSAARDSGMGAVYAEMVDNILQPILFNSDINFVRYDVFHALPSNANTMIGRAAHIAVLDSELFIEKLLTVSVVKYFK